MRTARMDGDRFGAIGQGETYGGFASQPPPAPGRPPRRLSRIALVGGVAAALAAGLVLGLLAQPQIGVMERRPMAPVSRTPLPVEIVPPAPTPKVKAAGKLEVLPPDMARAARAAEPSRRLALPQRDLAPPDDAETWRAPADAPAPAYEGPEPEPEPLPGDWER